MAVLGRNFSAFKVLSWLPSDSFAPCRFYAVTGFARADKVLDTVTRGRISGWLRSYENLVGLTEVRAAQTKVIQVKSGRVPPTV